MKMHLRFSLLFFISVCFFPSIGFSQFFTPPDTVLIRKFQVHEVRIFFDDTSGVRHKLQQVRTYDHEGRCICVYFAAFGNFTRNTFDTAGHLTVERFYKKDSTLNRICRFEYLPCGKVSHELDFQNGDTIHPVHETRNDTAGHTVLNIHFKNGTITEYAATTFDPNGLVHSYYDSTKENVSWYDNHVLLRETINDPSSEFNGKWVFIYDDSMRLIRNYCSTKKGNDYTIVYKGDSIISLSLNGKKITGTKYYQWRKQWYGNLPIDYQVETRIYKVPVPDYTHDLVYDPTGLLIEDRIVPKTAHAFSKTVFEYEYEFWK